MKRVSPGIAAIWAAVVPAGLAVAPLESAVTAGSTGHGPFSVCGARARFPAFMVSQASSGQVCGRMA